MLHGSFLFGCNRKEVNGQYKAVNEKGKNQGKLTNNCIRGGITMKIKKHLFIILALELWYKNFFLKIESK